MRLLNFCLLAATAVAAFSAIAPAAAAELDSSNFSHQYNGNVLPIPNYTVYNGWAVSPSSDGDILSWKPEIDNPAGNNGYWESTQWGGAIADAVGWTMEFRLKIGDDSTEEGDAGAFNFVVSDGGPGSHWFTLKIGQGALKTDGGVLIDEFIHTDDFHTYRLAQGPSSNITRVWRDGALLGDYAGTRNQSSQLWWGDGSGNIGGPTVYLDYMRFDNTGVYDPVGYNPPVEPVVFYREIFPNTTEATIGLDAVGWQAHHGTAAVSVGGNPADPAEIAQWEGGRTLPPVNSNFSETIAYGYTWHWDLEDGKPHVFWTDEYTLTNVSEIEAIYWEQLHTGTDLIPQVAVRVAGNWYASNQSGEITGAATSLGAVVELDFKAATWSSLNFTPAPTIPGDANNDGAVNAGDAAALSENWLQETVFGRSAGDFNNDGVVNDIDATIMATNWGATTSGHLSLGGEVGSLPAGDITAFGLFIPSWPEGEGAFPYLRFDNFTILGPLPASATSVPEPSLFALIILGTITLYLRKSK